MNTGMMEGREECCMYGMQTCLINKPNPTLILFVSPDNSCTQTTDHGLSPLLRIPSGRWHCCDFDLYNVIEFQFGPSKFGRGLDISQWPSREVAHWKQMSR